MLKDIPNSIYQHLADAGLFQDALPPLSENLSSDKALRHVVLAYSGGLDSSVLLQVLKKLQEKHAFKVTAAYYQHHWREPAEYPIIHQNCAMLGIPLVIVTPCKTDKKTESSARMGRYKALTKLAQDLRADMVLTAHHADDQAETLLFRIFRGTGIEGLSGIQKRLVLSPPDGEPVPIVRPMLDVYREDILRYAHDLNTALQGQNLYPLRWFEDPTNEDMAHTRNALRKQVLPVIQQVFPQVKTALNRMADVVSGDTTILQDQFETLWQKAYQDNSLWVPFLSQTGLAYQRRIIKRFLADHDIESDFQRVEEILAFVLAKTRKDFDTALFSLGTDPDNPERKQFLSLYKNRLSILWENDAEARALAETVVTVSDSATHGVYPLPLLDIRLEIIPADHPEEVLESEDVVQSVEVDLSMFDGLPLQFRTRRPGDHLVLPVIAEMVRFKKYLIQQDVPAFERDRLPILTNGRHVLWVPGMCVSDDIHAYGPATHRLRLLKGANATPDVGSTGQTAVALGGVL